MYSTSDGKEIFSNQIKRVGDRWELGVPQSASRSQGGNVDGSRIRKDANGADTYDMNDPDGKTELVEEGVYNSTYTYNIWGEDNLGQIKDNSGSLSRYYYLEDHLGNIRMVLNQSGGVDSYNDYYPFGAQMPGRNLSGSADGRYKLRHP